MIYGLSGSVWTKDGSRSMRMTRALNTGIIWVNCMLDGYPQIPVPPHKMSGTGVELGMEGLMAYCKRKTAVMAYDDNAPVGWNLSMIREKLLEKFKGKPVFDLPTPSLVADITAMDNNLAKWMVSLPATRSKLRPHFKSHKCVTLARRQMDLPNTVGITCAKLIGSRAAGPRGVFRISSSQTR